MTTIPSPRHAFTLVETLVAVSVLLLAVVGPLTITARTAKSSSFASEQVIAHFLAQEGLELAQRARDTAILQSGTFSNTPPTVVNPWSRAGGFRDPASSNPLAPCFAENGNGCGLHLNSSAPFSVVVTTCTSANCLLRLSTNPNEPARYHHGSAAPQTKFTRVIRFESVGPPANPPDLRQIRVVSEVTWRSGAILAPQRVRLETYLFDIYGL